jgi:pyruvate/2-oxoglutarate dehydrogenase complex dihydrolipoamide dehydrogenase (E3) component
MQPRRSQILELLEWYERQLARLNVDVRLNAPMDGDEIKAFGADSVLLATGSQPAMSGFQRGLPQQDRMAGVGLPNVWSVEDVMGKLARPGKRVILVDDTGDWRGGGTAWYLAEQGHQVTIVTTWAMVGFWIQRTAGDGKLRSRLAQLGATWLTESAVLSWHGDGATVRNLLDGSESVVVADALVLATTNVSETSLAEEMARLGSDYAMAGDNVSPRLAVHAIYEGRVAGMEI